ncbi:MAG TPA: guanylate kinase [Rhabdochlamydiaceae bacterium]|nr:guanylate kinase [Rhabdochlamydiaceae bacterium]
MEKLLGNLTEGLVFVISAPAGTGKTTLVKMLCDEFISVADSISCTTRPPRPGEINGKDYYFLKKEDFEAKIAAGEFLEYAKVFDHYYGTLKEHVVQEQKKGKHVVLVIDTQGAMQLKEKKFPAIFIFISPPNFQELRERLFKRQTEHPELIEQRLSWAKHEMTMMINYDYHMVNDNLARAYEILRSIFIAEEHKTR